MKKKAALSYAPNIDNDNNDKKNNYNMSVGYISFIWMVNWRSNHGVKPIYTTNNDNECDDTNIY